MTTFKDRGDERCAFCLQWSANHVDGFCVQPHTLSLTCPGDPGDLCPGTFTTSTNAWIPDEKDRHLASPFHIENVNRGGRS